MNSRERIKRAINFACPDRIPYHFEFKKSAVYKYGKAILKLSEQYPGDLGPSLKDMPVIDSERLKKFEAGLHYTYTDEWGITWDEVFFERPIPISYPLEYWKSLEKYKLPVHSFIDKIDEFEKLASAQKEWVKTYYGRMGGGRIFELLQWLRGYENLMFDFMNGSNKLKKLADMIVEWNIEEIKFYIKAGSEGLFFYDDWGTQTALMISPELWRKFFKPLYKKMFAPAVEAGIDIWLHSDGYIMEILPDLKEVGVTVINPQFSCHNLEQLSKICYELKLAVQSSLDRQYILPFGIQKEIEEHIEEVIYYFAHPEGGFFLNVEIEPDMPLENIKYVMEICTDMCTKILG